VREAGILILGVAYKADVNDVRESPALEIIEMLDDKGANVSYADPYVPQLSVGNVKLAAVEATPEAIAAADCVLILTNHSSFDYSTIAARASLVVDTRNALKVYRQGRDSIVTL
jgi:UDP-N-acetyl-D-glucosamine dehydrogenase